jgi:hypothetical protein
MNTRVPLAGSTEKRDWLVNKIKGAALWRGYLATVFQNDTRNVRCSETLHAMAAAVNALPANHPLFTKLEQIHRVDGAIREHCRDELDLAILWIGLFPAESRESAIQHLVEVTEASLRD